MATYLHYCPSLNVSKTLGKKGKCVYNLEKLLQKVCLVNRIKFLAIPIG